MKNNKIGLEKEEKLKINKEDFMVYLKPVKEDKKQFDNDEEYKYKFIKNNRDDSA